MNNGENIDKIKLEINFRIYDIIGIDSKIRSI